MDSIKFVVFDPIKEPEDAESGDDIEIVDPEEEDAALSQVRKANVKLQKSVKDIPGLHPDDKVCEREPTQGCHDWPDSRKC